MDIVLGLLTYSYDLINSINLQPFIGLPLGLCDLFMGVLVIYTLCSIIMSGLFGKIVDYVHSPTEQEKFHEDVYKYKYGKYVGSYARMQSSHNRELNSAVVPSYVKQDTQKDYSFKVKSVLRHRRRERKRGNL